MSAPYRHLFFDMDKTIAPARQPILPEMYELLAGVAEDVVIVSGQLVEKIEWQSNNLPAIYLGNNGNHANDVLNQELWKNPDLTDGHRREIHAHIDQIVRLLEHDLNHEWTPIEDRGSQITFSPIGNTAPVEIKKAFDPDRSKRFGYLEQAPFQSEEIMLKIGGSTSFDYFHKDRHKGVNVRRLIDTFGWNPEDCVYIGDGLYPGGNDEVVMGVIDTIPVQDHHDTYHKLTQWFDGRETM